MFPYLQIYKALFLAHSTFPSARKLLHAHTWVYISHFTPTPIFLPHLSEFPLLFSTFGFENKSISIYPHKSSKTGCIQKILFPHPIHTNTAPSNQENREITGCMLLKRTIHPKYLRFPLFNHAKITTQKNRGREVLKRELHAQQAFHPNHQYLYHNTTQLFCCNHIRHIISSRWLACKELSCFYSAFCKYRLGICGMLEFNYFVLSGEDYFVFTNDSSATNC